MSSTSKKAILSAALPAVPVPLEGERKAVFKVTEPAEKVVISWQTPALEKLLFTLIIAACNCVEPFRIDKMQSLVVVLTIEGS